MRPTRSILLATLLTALLLPGPAQARKALIGKSKVTFVAMGSPGALSFEGRTAEIRLEDQGEQLVFTVPMETVDTGIDVRDHHMRETYIQTASFPDAILTVPAAELTLPGPDDKPTEGTVQGQFTVHGVTQPVQIEWSAKTDKLGWKLQASFPFDVAQHGVAIPSYMGVTVDAAMRAEASLRLVEATNEASP